MARVKFNTTLSPVNILSLGAGKQSTYMLIQALSGHFGSIPDYAVFADTGDEPEYVYTQLAFLKNYCLRHFKFQIVTVSGGNLQQDILSHLKSSAKSVATPPFWSNNGGNLRRSCTDKLKIRPVRKFIRSVMDKRPVKLWIGISYDEIERQRISDVNYISHFYPLIEQKITLSKIKSYFQKNNYPEPGKSSCITCPFHSKTYWRKIKQVEPNSFQSAIDFDKKIRHFKKNQEQFFLHRDRIPLSQSIHSSQYSLFPELIEECEGLCGL
jgi:hypothetical protein